MCVVCLGLLTDFFTLIELISVILLARAYMVMYIVAIHYRIYCCSWGDIQSLSYRM